MQRALVILTVILLVTVSLGVGALAAHWPFWRRAWQWQADSAGWPARLAGPVRVLHGGADALHLTFREDETLAAVAAAGDSHALMVASGDGGVDAWFAPGIDAHSVVDGRGLATALLAPLFAILGDIHPGLLDRPVGASLDEWRGNARGAITPRQLFWQLSGLPAGNPDPFNPFSARAQLAAGPDFERAALAWRPAWPPGTHFEESPANAQLLSLVAARVDGAAYAEVLERRLWSRFAAGDGIALLDHRRGGIAAHCCVKASLADWLRLALLLAADGRISGSALWATGFIEELGAASPVHGSFGLGFQLVPLPEGRIALALGSGGRHMLIAPHARIALLWIGEGQPPDGLERLLVP